MKDTVRGGSSPVAAHQETSRRRRSNERCSICTQHIWFNAIPLREPESVPEPRRTWVLCSSCHQALLAEMRRSPVRSPYRLRIAMGIVAAERSPSAIRKPRPLIGDRAWIVVIAWGFVIAMLLHLLLIVMIAFVAR